MKSFKDICKMTQPEVKDYMKEYLTSKKYDVVNEDGFLYAKGDIPVLLVAHMDTVHKETCKTINEVDGKLSSPEGIGGDDRCGVYIIMLIAKELHCSVLLCEDEEKGGIGARKFTQAKYKHTDAKGKTTEKKYIENLGVNYMIEFDRKGCSDAVFYSCDNKEFTNFVTDCTGFKFATGSFSDISTLMPASKIAGVNLSSGYYKAHTTDEYVVYDEMIDTAATAIFLIKEEVDKPFKYVAKQYKPTNIYNNYNSSLPRYERDMYYENLYDMNSKHVDKGLYKIAKNEKLIEMEVIIVTLDGEEEIIFTNGETKDECWKNLFLDNPDLCFNQITDWNFS